MISQFFILTYRGDVIVCKDYRGDVVRGTCEIFFRKVKQLGKDAPPIFNVEGVQFLHIKRNGLFFVCTTRFNISPAMTLELLTRISNLCKDYCGVISEESIRRNFVLVYELLDEVIDSGYGQITSTEQLKSFIHSTPVLQEGAKASPAIGRIDLSSRPQSIASFFTLTQKDRKSDNEVYIDVSERLTVLVNSNGSIVRAEIDGSIYIKSFLSTPSDIHIGLNDDISVGKEKTGYGLRFDDCNFHSCVSLDDFESSKVLSLRAPDGELPLMHYRIANAFNQTLPFCLAITIEHASRSSVQFVIKLDVDSLAKSQTGRAAIRIPLPKGTITCSNDVDSPGQTLEYKRDDKIAIWTIQKLSGSRSYSCRLKISATEDEIRHLGVHIGSVSMTFEVPMFLCSGLNVRSLRIVDRSGRQYDSEDGEPVAPMKWVRLVSHSDSYVFRV